MKQATQRAAVLIAVEPMHAAECFAALAALRDRPVIAALLGILRPDVLLVLAIAAEVLEDMPRVVPRPLNTAGMKRLSPRFIFRGNVDDVGVGDHADDGLWDSSSSLLCPPHR